MAANTVFNKAPLPKANSFGGVHKNGSDLKTAYNWYNNIDQNMGTINSTLFETSNSANNNANTIAVLTNNTVLVYSTATLVETTNKLVFANTPGANIAVANTPAGATVTVVANNASCNLSANGYSTHVSGLITQWGKAAPTGSTATITFPVPFPNACFAVTLTPITGEETLFLTVPPGTTSFDVTFGVSGLEFNWMALGN